MLNNEGITVAFPARAGDFSLLRGVPAENEVQSASYSKIIRGSLPRGKMARRDADHSPPSKGQD